MLHTNWIGGKVVHRRTSVGICWGFFLSLLEAQMRYDVMRKKLIQLTQIE